ncbi:hypothetical protein BH11CYA1_BH11CYA1_08610 [soil metagenome]
MTKHFLLLLSLTLVSAPVAYAAKEMGIDAISGQMRQISKGDNVFVSTNAVTTVEISIPPTKTPREWFSSVDDVVGRKTKFSIPAGSIVTEKFFGPRGTTLHPEEIKEF